MRVDEIIESATLRGSVLLLLLFSSIAAPYCDLCDANWVFIVGVIGKYIDELLGVCMCVLIIFSFK